MSVRVVPEGGTVLRYRWLRNGIIDLFQDSQSITAHQECYRAEQRVPDGGPFQSRMIFGPFIGAFGYAVRADSPIKTIYDIGPETRVAMFPPPSDILFGMLNWAGLSKGPMLENPREGEWNVKIVPYSTSASKAILDGRADLTMSQPTNPGMIEQAASPMGIRWLDLPYDTEPDGVERFRDAFPCAVFGPAPNEGVKEAWGVKTILLPRAIFSRADMDDEVAYHLTKWFDENYDKFKDKSPELPQMNMETFRKTLDVAVLPVHPGTIRYLKEIGKWTAADDARHEYNLRLMQAYIDAWNKALDQASIRKIKVAADSAEFAELWLSVKRGMGLPRTRVMPDEKMEEGLRFLTRLGF